MKNAYFVCAVSAISEHPERIYRLFSNENSRDNGAYFVALMKLGNWNNVLVDDYLPTIRNPSRVDRLIGASSLENEMWVSILEKAYAKQFGGYYEIGNGGDPRICLNDLTGAPCEMLRIENFLVDPDGFWDKIKHADESNHIICCGSKFDESCIPLYKKIYEDWNKKYEGV